MRKNAFWLTLVLSLFFTLSSLLWSPTASAFTEEQKLILQSWRIVNQSYLDDTFNDQNWWFLREQYLKKPINSKEKAYEAIEEMLASLNDPYTRLMRPEQYHSLQVSTSGELSGVGLQINLDPDSQQLQVVAPLSGSPAENAGIKAKDLILAIDGEKTMKMTLDEAAAKMRGKIGTKVNLTVKSAEKEPKTVELVRDRISLNPVIANLDKRGGVPLGYIRLNQFSANATEEIAHSVVKLEKQGAEGYILDLRNNPGGLLQAGIEIARLWLDEGTIVYTVNRQGMLDSFESFGPAITEKPLVLLVNEGTASASEILAGALQDNGRALLIGEKTFGKGLIQSLFELPDGAGLAVTVAKYETPAHKDINKLGIKPDQIVSQEPITYGEIGSEKDQQYQTAITLLSQKTVLAKAN